MYRRTDFEVADLPPTPSEFVAARAACGWGVITEAVAAQALGASVLDVTVRRNGAILGMGRVVGDGALYFYVQDVIVIPDERGIGVGRAVMERLMERLHALASPGATIGLMSAAGKEGFYTQFGFSARPAPGYGAGMTRFVV